MSRNQITFLVLVIGGVFILSAILAMDLRTQQLNLYHEGFVAGCMTRGIAKDECRTLATEKGWPHR